MWVSVGSGGCGGGGGCGGCGDGMGMAMLTVGVFFLLFRRGRRRGN